MTTPMETLFFHLPVKSDMRFPMHINNKYYCGTKPLEVSLIDTVKSRSEGYTNQHMNHAKM